jgi:replicative DNA helicase|tara:strand:- start:220 stop:1626 length:1407 start_codon:yes stop_codon:yes gene_type:complete
MQTAEKIERTALRNLIHNEDYTRKVLPFLKSEYFQDRSERVVFSEIQKFISQYNRRPTKETLQIDLNKRKDLNEDEYKKIVELISSLDPQDVDLEWLVNTTEKFCKDRAVHNAVMEGIHIIDGKDKKHSPEAIPEILRDALSVSFDNAVGHDYLLDIEKRFDYYHKKETRIPFDLDYFNKVTKGGLPTKTLNVALAGTGVGKTLFMCHQAASALAQNKNVLYITMEMAEERIAERIDANLLNISMEDLHMLNKKLFNDKITQLQSKTTGTLIIKEYPTASAGANHYRALVNELALKRTFKPDIIFIDYINICASSRFKAGSNVNSYTYIKAIAEELRGLAVELDVPIVTATQTTRGGFVSSDIGLEDTSESFGLPATADFMFALISSEELEKAGQMLVKQLKNRYNDPTLNRKFIIGVDRARMKLFDIEQQAQNLIQPEETKYVEHNLKETQEESAEEKYKKFQDFQF